MEIVVIAAIVGLSAYMLVKKKKIIHIKPQINKKNKLPLEMSDSEYLERIIAENNEKERVGKMEAENKERIKKDFL